MIVGVIGLGIVGHATSFGFKKLGHKVLEHDIKFNTRISDVLHSEIAFICVPTPSHESGRCDTSIVESVVQELIDLKYKGIIAIRSTVIPGTTQRLQKQYPKATFCFIPEFLRERCAVSDFVENNNLLAIGTESTEIYNMVKNSFGHYPKNHAMMSPTEAELLKYYHNTFSALRVVFANEFFEICQQLGANYTKVKNGLIRSAQLPDIYLDVNHHMRGYSSICWNKDIPAICQLAKALELDLPLLSTIEPANDRFQKTPFEGTRI